MMKEIKPPCALLFHEDGYFLVKPKHDLKICAKGLGVGWATNCPGCQYDFHVAELLQLVEYKLPHRDATEEGPIHDRS